MKRAKEWMAIGRLVRKMSKGSMEERWWPPLNRQVLEMQEVGGFRRYMGGNWLEGPTSMVDGRIQV